MVGKVISRMNKEISGLHEAAYLLAIFAFLSQVLALLRDRAFAHFFGAGPTLDAYFAAFRIPDFVFAILTLFVSSFALIPLISKRGGVETEGTKKLIGSVLGVFGFISIFVSYVLFLYIPNLVPVIFPGFTEGTKDTVIILSRVMLLQPIILGLSSVVASIVQSSRKFILYALAPIFYNLGIIFGAIFLYPTIGVVGLAWGVVIGAVLHFLIQVLPLTIYQKDWNISFMGDWLKDIKEVAKVSLPRALALSANQFLLLFFIGIASLAAAGSVASISFAFNLQSVPLSIVGVSYAAAVFPALSMMFSRNEIEKFTYEVWATIRHVIFWTTPAIALMIVLRAHMVRVVLGSGEFNWSDTRLTAAILAAFVISLVAQASILIFSRAYYASGRSFEPVFINVGVAFLAGLCAYFGVIWFQGAETARFFFEDLFRIGGIPGSETLMIALSYSGVLIIGVLVFAFLFSRRFGFDKSVLKTMFFSFSASIIAAASSYLTLQAFGPLLPTETFIGIFTQGLVAGLVGLLFWGLTLYSLGSTEFKEVLAVATNLIKKRKLNAEQP